MTKQTKLVAAIVLAGLGAVAAQASTGEKHREDDAEHQAFHSASVSLTAAVKGAEAETGARAMSAEFDNEDGVYIYDIELLTADGAELEVQIDASSGTVLEVEADEDEGDNKDKGNHEEEKDSGE